MNRKKGICYLVGAGEDYGLDFCPGCEDYVIAVDGGFRLLEQKGISVNLAIGDFDTLGYRPKHPNVIALKAEKDDTDMLAAVEEGVRTGYERFCIYCGTGGRLEHTIANLQLLADLSRRGKQGYLFDRECVMTAITNGTLTFSEKCSGYVSVLSHSEKSAGVYLEGLKYELTDAVLTSTFPLGISNEFTGRKSRISVRDGTVWVFWPRQSPMPELWPGGFSVK